MLDIGANLGWFDHALLTDFNCVCIAVDRKHIDKRRNLHHMKRHLTGDELNRWSRCEHFDIVLGLAVLHHIPDYEEALLGMLNLGSHVFIEIPGEGDGRAAGKARHGSIRALLREYEPYTHFTSHTGPDRPLYRIEREPYLVEQTLDAKERGAPTYGKYRITSDFDKSRIRIDRTGRKSPLRVPIEERDFIPGVNLHNYRLLGGVAEYKPEPGHPDNHPWNYVIGVNGTYPIDTINKWA